VNSRQIFRGIFPIERFAGLFALLLLAPLLGGCDLQTLKGSVAGSCAVFERPPYAVRGKTTYDQNVADNFVESGVGGCNWQRPAPRPAALDSPARQSKVTPPPAKRRGLLKRIRDRVLPAKPAEPSFPHQAAPIEPVPEPPAVGLPLPAPQVIERRDPIDELLYPKGR
jgi:hypothetical protein